MVSTMMADLGFPSIGMICMMVSSFTFMLTSFFSKAFIKKYGNRKCMFFASLGNLLLGIYMVPGLVCTDKLSCTTNKRILI